MTFDRDIAVFIGLLALCVMLVLMVLHLTEVIAAPSVKCQATPPKVDTYVNWRIIDGHKCYYIGKQRLDKSLLYWEPEKSLPSGGVDRNEQEEMPLPTPAPAIRAQSDFEDRWQGLINRENLLEPTRMEHWK
jgi:hypothetical protein